ncbi:hypothetical protein BHE74_00015605 [Ensete ventricosum]|nr:hypothetical protein BHE74_00015605 [Ensete ventricosum]RZR91492.1 hypothetical protein BHM03_00019600 [Ensete ventricosum]
MWGLVHKRTSPRPGGRVPHARGAHAVAGRRPRRKGRSRLVGVLRPRQNTSKPNPINTVQRSSTGAVTMKSFDGRTRLLNRCRRRNMGLLVGPPTCRGISS